MNRKDLDKRLNEWIKDLPQEDRKSLLARLSGLKSVFPFNEYEYRLMYLLDKEIISFKEYEVLRKAYVDVNPYLRLYGIAPRVFGEIWAQQHLVDIDQRFKKPSKEIDKNYSGDYDLYLKNDKKIIKIEVKASRAINTKVREHPTRSHQHRGGIEYQIGITNKNFNEFKQFIVKPTRLVSTIKKKVEK